MSARPFLLLLLFVSACAINPVTGRPELTLISTRGEQSLGEEQSKAVESELGLVDRERLTSWVTAIGQRLATHSPRHDVSYEFHVVDAEEPNAFALPGGYVYVTRGLLALVNSEDELAAVLAHEIGHVAARHSAQQITRAAPFAVVTNVGAAVTGLASQSLGRAVGGVGGLATAVMLAPFSRDQEREADRVGQDLAAASGWDPAALPAFLSTLEAQQVMLGNASSPGFLASHPATPERVSTTRAYAATRERAAPQPIEATRGGVLSRLDGLVVGAPASRGIARGRAFVHPGQGTFMRFPEDFKVVPVRRMAIGIAKDEESLVILETVGEGDDPMDAPRALEKRTGAKVVEITKPVKVPGLRAVGMRGRIQTDSGDAIVAISWIAYGGRIHQVLGAARMSRAEAFLAAFDEAVATFRPLTGAERAAVREEHLRVVPALEDESMTAFTARTKTVWKPEMVALVNELPPATMLSRGQLLKVSLSEPYAPSH